MADYDDAESPVGARAGYSRGSTRATGPLGAAWAWFSKSPPTTKLIVVGVIVVIGVVAWMVIRGNKAAAASSDGEDKPGKFLPLGQRGPGSNGPTGIVTFPSGVPVSGGDTSNAPSYPPPTAPTSMPGSSGPTGIASRPAQANSNITQAAAYRPPTTFAITPEAVSHVSTPTGRGTNVSF